MLIALTFALVSAVPAGFSPVCGDTVSAGAVVAEGLSPTLKNVFPERFGPDGGYVLVPVGSSFDAAPQRAKAVEHNDLYYTRLKIHRVGAIVMVPLFVAQYLAGQELYQNGAEAAQWARDAHSPLAASLAVVYGINAVTGIWNAIDDWKAPGRARRTVHGALMLLAGAGFVAVASTAPESEDGYVEGNPSNHRNLAIASMSTVMVSGLMMLIWK